VSGNGHGRSVLSGARLLLQCVFISLLAAGADAKPLIQATAPDLSTLEASVVGADACERCHVEVHAKWDASRHSKMVRPATPDIVIGDFNRKRVTLRGQPYGFRIRDDKYYISESYLTPDVEEREVEYTLGSRRIQHYLTTLEDGRIVVLPPTWDVLREEWFHNLDIAARDQKEEGVTTVQVWNKNCFGCHVSEEAKNYDQDSGTYQTSWLDFGTNCERCHGPGSVHVLRYEQEDTYRDDPDGYIVAPDRLDAARSSMVCAQCHSFRDVLAFGFTAGNDYFDHFLPLLEYSEEPTSDPVWYQDGKTRRFSTNALGLWQSACFNRGDATCITCHVDMHQPEIETERQLEPTKKSLCTRCHDELANDVTAHTFHEEKSTGSACVSCHMPKSVTSIKATMRDHSISIPVPENTIRFGVPNACNLCHDDQSPEWALESLERWYPNSTAREKWADRAEAFAAAKNGEASALSGLLAVLDDEQQDPINRANAVGYLGNYPGRQAIDALGRSLADEHALVRAISALKLGDMADFDAPRAQEMAIASLDDDKQTVRMNAAISLLNLGVKRLSDDAATRFETAKSTHAARGSFHADDAPQQLNLGRFYVLNGDGMNAGRAFEQSYRLNPDQPTIKYFMAVTQLSRNNVDEAKKLLKAVPKDDPFRTAAQDLLEKLR